LSVIVGQRPGSANYDLAVEHGFEPMTIEDATRAGDLVNILLPDEVQADVFREQIEPNLEPGNVLLCSHGFNIHFGQVVPPEGVDAALVAPKGPGHLVRIEYENGGGVPSLIAMLPGASDESRQLALAYSKGIGGTRGGVIETTFAEETETDLFGEQVVLCGGVSALVSAAFDTLVEAGYQPEMAYFECMHELKLIVDLIYRGGLNYMRYSVSDTAEHGDYTGGPRVVTDETRAAMRSILKDIQTGAYAEKWIAEDKAGRPWFMAQRKAEQEHQIETVGQELRGMMPFLDAVNVKAPV
jgi:ketol-acid reductoisomerase